jgi:hypothetical protein
LFTTYALGGRAWSVEPNRLIPSAHNASVESEARPDN